MTKKTASAQDQRAVVLDSSCWLEVFDGGERAQLFEALAAEPEQLIVPVITIYEVMKYLLRVKGQSLAQGAALYMQRGQVVDLDAELCMNAVGNGLPLADSLIYATAQAHSAVLWTQDAHFEGLSDVRYFAKTLVR